MTLDFYFGSRRGILAQNGFDPRTYLTILLWGFELMKNDLFILE
jgi:hypothetical protein